MNHHRVYGLTEYARGEYAKLCVPLEQRADDRARERGLGASACAACGLCETKCPQKLKIVDQLRETHTALG